MSTSSSRSVVANLERLLSVRVLLLLVVSLLILGVHFGYGLALPIAPLSSIIVALALLTAWSCWRVRRQPQRIREGELAGQLMMDVAGLTALLYFSGGWTNPLVSLYLVPIAVAVIMLDRVTTWIITATTILGYSLLILYHQPVVTGGHDHPDAFTLHVAGMWMTFVLAGGLIAYFGTSMVNMLRSREQALAAEREENLRHEQIIGVATLAAGTAHELSTPLGSIAVIASELADAAEGYPKEQLELLLAQVAVCRETLGRLRQTASGEQGMTPVSVVAFMEELRARLQLYRPRSRLLLSCDGADAAPEIRPEPTLQQALLNLLDNSAAVSEQPVECRLRWRADQLEIDILDRGPGFDGATASAREQSDGLGMGLILANATIERLGGSVSLLERSGGGAHVAIRLPLGRLQEHP